MNDFEFNGKKLQSVSIDLAELYRVLEKILAPNQVVEIRALGVSNSNYQKPHTKNGFFNDLQKLTRAVQSIQNAKGIYFTPNPVNPDLLARAANRLQVTKSGTATSDSDIISRRWLLIDCDPVRSSGISSTDEEHKAALARALEIRNQLKSDGWPDPIFADSGNGAHLLYRIDLPANDEGLVKRCLEALAFRFGDNAVSIDETVHNPARIWKLYGTVARKGDHTIERPHRVSRMLEIPERLIVVPKSLLKALADSIPTSESVKHDLQQSDKNGFDLDSWIAKNQLNVAGPTPWKNGRKWVFNHCPWNKNHANKSAFILQFSNGAIAAGCQHNSCKDFDWHSLRDTIEPDWRRSNGKNAKIGNDGANHSADDSPSKPPTADRLYRYALENADQLFCDQFGQPHALVDNVALPLTSRCYGWLRRLMLEKEKRTVSGDVLKQAAGTLAAVAEGKHTTRELHVRSAFHNGALYVELAPQRIIRIDRQGWQVVQNPPVLFRKYVNIKPLPVPKTGDRLESLIDMLPLKTPQDQRLLMTYLILGLMSHIPRPILLLTGSMGGGKSTTHRVVKRLLDPGTPETIRLDPRDALQKASHAAVIFIDNANSFQNWAIDIICRLVTGEADAKRMLYTDDVDWIFEMMRLVLINGVNPPANRPDFLDRSLCIELARIPDGDRLTEQEFWATFEKQQPYWLDDLFMTLSHAIREFPKIQLEWLPRLADWGQWAAAVYQAKGWGAKLFLEDWRGNIGKQTEAVLETNTLLQVIIDFLAHCGSWEGLPNELLNALESMAEAMKLDLKHDDSFPKSVDWLWRRIREIESALNAHGIKPDRKGRKIVLQKSS